VDAGLETFHWRFLMKKILGFVAAVRLIALAVSYYRMNPNGKRKLLNEL